MFKVVVNEEGLGGGDTCDALRYAVKSYGASRLGFP